MSRRTPSLLKEEAGNDRVEGKTCVFQNLRTLDGALETCDAGAVPWNDNLARSHDIQTSPRGPGLKPLRISPEAIYAQLVWEAGRECIYPLAWSCGGVQPHLRTKTVPVKGTMMGWTLKWLVCPYVKGSHELKEWKLISGPTDWFAHQQSRQAEKQDE